MPPKARVNTLIKDCRYRSTRSWEDQDGAGAIPRESEHRTLRHDASDVARESMNRNTGRCVTIACDVASRRLMAPRCVTTRASGDVARESEHMTLRHDASDVASQGAASDVASHRLVAPHAA